MNKRFSVSTRFTLLFRDTRDSIIASPATSPLSSIILSFFFAILFELASSSKRSSSYFACSNYWFREFSTTDRTCNTSKPWTNASWTTFTVCVDSFPATSYCVSTGWERDCITFKSSISVDTMTLGSTFARLPSSSIMVMNHSPGIETLKLTTRTRPWSPLFVSFDLWSCQLAPPYMSAFEQFYSYCIFRARWKWQN